MIRLLKSIAGFVAFRTGLHRLVLGGRAVIVLFHRVELTGSPSPLHCDPAAFARLCRFFQRFFVVIALDELLRRLAAGQSIARRLAITFDDGYLDNATQAAPLLQKHGLPATFFVTTGFIGSDRQTWWDRHWGLASTWMTWDDVRALHQQGFSIGAHTETHVDLGRVNGSEAHHEIVRAAEPIRRALGVACDVFSYPYGSRHQMTEANRAIVREAGYRCCLSAHGGSVSPGSDPYRLRREPVSSEYRSGYDFGFDVLRNILVERIRGEKARGNSQPRSGSTPSLAIATVTTAEQFAAMEDEWDDLLVRSVQPGGCSSWSWLFAWWRTYGRRLGTLRIATARAADGCLVGMAPLFLWRRHLLPGLPPVRTLALLGGTHAGSDYLDFLIDREHESACREALFTFLFDRCDWDALVLNDVPADSPHVEALGAFLERRNLTLRKLRERVCPVARLPESFEAYMQQLSPGRRADIRRKRRKLEAAGNTVFSIVRTQEELDAALANFIPLNRARLAEKGERGGFMDPTFEAFQREAMASLLRKDQLRVCLLCVDDEPIAGLYNLRLGDTWHFYQSGMARHWARYSPLTVLFAMAIEWAIEQEHVRVFDFMRGDEPYKHSWTNDRRVIETHVLFRPGWRGQSGRVAFASQRALRSGLRACLRRNGDDHASQPNTPKARS